MATIRARPQFVNPFERQRSVDKVPTLASVTPLQPLLTNDSTNSDTSGSGQSSAGWRTRAASMFQSISSNSSNGSNVGNAVQLKERVPSMAPRKPSYVPKYAARAHLSSMTGRMTSASDVEIDAQLRRESRMMSVVSAGSFSDMPEASSSSAAARKPS